MRIDHSVKTQPAPYVSKGLRISDCLASAGASEAQRVRVQINNNIMQARISLLTLETSYQNIVEKPAAYQPEIDRLMKLVSGLESLRDKLDAQEMVAA